MKFTKMHGCGNDYVYVNAIAEKVENPSMVAMEVSDRHFGIGSDGLILIKASDVADFEMQMFNADGSEGAMCGNGIRCVGKYVYDFGLTDKTKISVNTKSGIKYLDLNVVDGKVETVRVNMGQPILAADQIPVISRTPEVIDLPLEIDDVIYRCTAVSMGNPHCVTFLGNIDNLEIEKIGPKFENHTAFPDRVNTEFIKLIDDQTIQMRVWERGSGETLACGTGACASAVAAILTEKVKGNKVIVELLGGTLEIEWDREENQVYLSGPATTVFNGEIDL